MRTNRKNRLRVYRLAERVGGDMFAFWHNFLYDAWTFGFTVYLTLALVLLIALVTWMMRN